MAVREVKGRKVRYGIVGGGWISQAAFMPGIGRTGNSEMTALVTGDPVKADALAGRYGLRSYGYGEIDRLIADGEVDALYVATPNFRHTEISVQALEAGLHVLLEKPMDVSEENCRRIMAAAQGSGAKLMIAYRLHFEPGNVELIERARRGDIGALRLFTSTFAQPLDLDNHRAKHGYWAGPVADMGPYPINAVRNLFGEEPIEVSAVGFRTPGRDLPFHDTVSVTLRFPGEKLGQFVVSYSAAGGNRFQLFGEKGSFDVSPCYGFGEGVATRYEAKIGGESETREFPVTDHFGGEADYFSGCIIDGRDPEPDGEEGLLDVRVLVAVERALETGETQTLAPMRRAGRVTPDQARTLPLAETPEMINADTPTTS